MPRDPSLEFTCPICKLHVWRSQLDSHLQTTVHREAQAKADEERRKADAAEATTKRPPARGLKNELLFVAERLRSDAMSHTDAANWILETADKLIAAPRRG